MLDRELHYAAELMRELNRMWGIETKLLMSFHSQTNEQIKQMNQELEQYFRLFIDYRQKDQPEWLVLAEFVVNNLVTKVSPFMANYSRELRIRADIRRKRKIEKTMEFAETMKKVQEKAGVVLRKAQEEMMLKNRKRKIR